MLMMVNVEDSRPAASPVDALPWLRSLAPAYVTTVDREGREDDGILVIHEGTLYLGYNPSSDCLEDYDEWRTVVACCPHLPKRLALRLVDERISDTKLLLELNRYGTMSADEYKRL